jgi:lysophospholipase L1-like esterase
MFGSQRASPPPLGRPARRRRLLGDIAIVLGVTAVALLACEGAVRILFPRIETLHWYAYDARYTMRHRANLDDSTTVWGDGGRWHFRTNSRGFRGEEWPATPEPGTARAIISGDSFVFGNGIDEGGAFPQVANRLLRQAPANEPQWRIVAMGVSAWGPQNALGYLETEGSDIGASCLVYSFFLGNDVMDNVRFGLYRLRDGVLERSPGTEAPGWAKTLRTLVITSAPYEFIVRDSQLVNLAGSVLTRRVDTRWEDYDRAVPPALYAEALDLNDATLTRMAESARQRFGAFALILIPPLDEMITRPAPLFSKALDDEARLRVKQWAAQHAVPVLDLVDELPRDRATLETLYFKKDFHLSAAGADWLGRLVALRLPTLCGARGPLSQRAR